LATVLAAGAIHLGLECVESALPLRNLGELSQPLGEWDKPVRYQRVKPPPTHELVAHQSAVSEHPQVSADCGSADRESPGDVAG
jgi:hypothetical protein